MKPYAEQLADVLAAKMARTNVISGAHADRLIALLHGAPSQALHLIVARRVKFCHAIASQILADRDLEKKMRQTIDT